MMSRLFRGIAGVGAWLLVFTLVLERAAGLGFEAFGPAGEHISRSPDWAKGVENVLRHSSRVYWYDVNGGEAAYYDGDIRTINDLLELFSQVQLVEHTVVLRPGRPSAKSFHGELTPYVVEFNVPGGISLHHAQEYAGTGLYSVTPRMIIHIDAALIENIAELKLPENVSLHELEVAIEDALAHADDDDVSLRYRAITGLGEAPESTGAIVDALKRAAADENKSIKAAGESALKQLEAANDPAAQSLRKRLSEFINSQPNRVKTPSPEEVLTALRRVDAEYLTGFTARGTLVKPAPLGAGRLVAWTLTMGNDRLVVEQRDVEDADHPPAEGRFEYTNYAGPDRMGSIHGSRSWVDGKLLDMKPMASFEPVGSTYDLLIGRVLWPLGRGFSRCIDRVAKVAMRGDGLLAVAAERDEAGLKYRWELVVDANADYLVRSAKGFRRDEKRPSYNIETNGVLTGGRRTVAHTARWTEGVAPLPSSIAVSSVSAVPDTDLIERTEHRLDSLPTLGQ